MANFIVTWTPAGALVATNQTVQYKNISAGGSWTTAATVGPAIGTYTFVGLDDNTAYEFRIITNCLYGGTANSINTLTSAKVLCPEITLTPGYNTTLGYFIRVFYNVPANFNYQIYDFTLYDASGSSIIDTNLGIIPSVSGLQYFEFSGLSPATTYTVTGMVKVDLSGTGSGPFVIAECAEIQGTTPAGAACNTPNLISVQPL